jgi:DNA topoisomerase-1
LEKGEVLPVEDVKLLAKETQPPKRFTPSSIIREMEKRNLGTKATRSQIVDILFRRGYLTGKTIEVTPLGINVVESLDKYCPDVLSEKLTRKFEKEMEEIESGKIAADKVIEEGKDTIKHISEEFNRNESKIGSELAGSFRTTKQGPARETMGKCHKCEGTLIMRKSKFGGYFIGCDNYPKCTYTISLPKTSFKVTGKCGTCGYPTITIYDRKPWTACINPECPTKKKTA